MFEYLALLVYIVDKCKELEGDIYDKAVFLFINLIRLHPFASGNRRTAFIVTKEFLTENNEKFKIADHPIQAKIMVGVRESYYTDKELKIPTTASCGDFKASN